LYDEKEGGKYFIKTKRGGESACRRKLYGLERNNGIKANLFRERRTLDDCS
jgi:hypothetical protein